MNIQIYWGVKGIDKSDASMWDANYIGRVEWDDETDFTSKASQESLIQLCKDLRSEKAEHIVLENYVVCWIETFETWYREETTADPETVVMPMEEK